MASTSRSRLGAAVVVAALILGVVVSCSTGPASDDDATSTERPARTVASTSAGEVRGAVDGDVVRFRSVPYAQAPVGELRLAAPRPVTRADGQIDARKAGPPCPQLDGSGELTGDEDCLHLNVTAPVERRAEPRPVMVWIPGGGFTQGDAADYDPRRLVVDGDVVVVTVNYRLGALGQLAPAGAEGSGTFGLADQQEALRFVRDNAAAFGGDPGNVTVFGQSAGGSSVCYHLVSPSAEDLFDRAIVQSAIDCGAAAPPYAYGLPPEEAEQLDGVDPISWRLPDVEARTAAVAAQLGCEGAEEAVLRCLRDLPVDELIATNDSFARPAIGGPLVPDEPVDALEEVDVPVLTGFTRDESRFYAILEALQQSPYPAGSYEAAIRTAFGTDATAVLDAYPREDFQDDAEAWSAVYTDRTFACPQLRANDLLARGTTVFAYEFTDRTAPPPLPLLPGAPAAGAAHTAELPYLFDVATQPVDETGQRIPLTSGQRDLAAEMVQIWAGFARTGEAPVEPWSAAGRALDLGADGVGETTPSDTHRCALWDDLDQP